MSGCLVGAEKRNGTLWSFVPAAAQEGGREGKWLGKAGEHGDIESQASQGLMLGAQRPAALENGSIQLGLS